MDMLQTGVRDSGLGTRSQHDVRTRQRVIVERVWPEIDGGRFPIKRTVGETITVGADIFADGYDLLAGVVKFRALGSGGRVLSDPAGWNESPLVARDNDRWEGTFTVSDLGDYEYTIEAWVDRFGSWLKGLVAKVDAAQDVASELLEGAELIQAAAVRPKYSGQTWS